jgi:hypothetical protein
MKTTHRINNHTHFKGEKNNLQRDPIACKQIVLEANSPRKITFYIKFIENL